MNYRLLIRPAAEGDLAEASRWYDQQREGLGEEFLAAVQQLLQGLQSTPERHAVVHRNVRKAVLRRFPYVIYYQVEGDLVSVVAVAHSRRDPRHWQSRVNGNLPPSNEEE